MIVAVRTPQAIVIDVTVHPYRHIEAVHTITHVHFDASLRPNEEQAAGIADMIIAFCGENGVTGKSADYAGILAEETVEHIRLFNGGEKQPRIDLICRITDAEIILSVRDDGEAFDPATVEDTEEEFTNLKMIKTLADKVSYTRALGLNNMLIKIGRK